MKNILDVVLLLALPASGKSETRKFLDLLSPDDCRDNFHIGPTLQLDDYPYVHHMHVIDDELKKRGYKYLFYKGPDRPFQNGFTWRTLIELLNEDFDDMVNHRVAHPVSASQWLFDRFDAAMVKAGMDPAMGEIPYRIRMEVAQAMENDVRQTLDEKNHGCSTYRQGEHTIVMEFARGGPNGAAFPLTPPHGYDYAFQTLSTAILDRASILYVKVTPAQSRAKNIERGKPGEQGSILHHSVPMEVMLGEYGCDDIQYLMDKSEKPDTIPVERIVADYASGSPKYKLVKWNIPIGIFDNTEDLTTFVREDKAKWAPADVARIRHGLGSALKTLSTLRN